MMGWFSSIKKRFYNHSANADIKTGSVYCFWEVKEEFSSEEFKEFIDGPYVPNSGQDILMNICKPIDKSLINGQTIYPAAFSW